MRMWKDSIRTLHYCKYPACSVLLSYEHRATVAILTLKNGKQSKKEVERICVKLDFLVYSRSFYHPDDKTLSLAVYTKS